MPRRPDGPFWRSVAPLSKDSKCCVPPVRKQSPNGMDRRQECVSSVVQPCGQCFMPAKRGCHRCLSVSPKRHCIPNKINYIIRFWAYMRCESPTGKAALGQALEPGTVANRVTQPHGRGFFQTVFAYRCQSERAPQARATPSLQSRGIGIALLGGHEPVRH